MNINTRRRQNEQYVIDNYHKQTYKEMGEALGLSRGSIQHIMKKYDLKKDMYSVDDYRRKVNEYDDFLRDWLSQLDSVEDLSKDDIIIKVNRFKNEANRIILK